MKYEGQTISADELARISSIQGYHVVNKFVDGIDIMAVANCSNRFDPLHDWPGRQEWDGESDPWDDQATIIDSEFRERFS